MRFQAETSSIAFKRFTSLLGLLGLLLCLAVTRPLVAQPVASTDLLPTDKNVTIGTLDNGLKYYIRVNHKPEKRALLRLAVNAGSVLENDDQLGLAHFVEHMAFDGTKHFPKRAITDYLERIGMRFGPEINAYTSFDETVYMLEMPTDSAGTMAKGMDILADWATGIAFEDTAIDKERGVIIEEWRQGQGAGMRILQRELPTLLRGSRYVDRIPIGKKEIIESFRPETLRDFYRTWYRPDLMAVVAVGDFDAGQIEALIKDRFSAIPLQADRKPREIFPVPDNDEMLAIVVSDKEATQTTVSMYHKLPMDPLKTVADYREYIAGDLYNRMLNARFLELTQRSDPPFVYATSGKSRFIRAKQFYQLGATVREDRVSLGLETILTEAERVRRFGFTQTELDREKEQLLRGYEKAYSERDKTESSVWASKYVSSFLYDDAIPGIEYTYEMAKQLVPGITLQEINDLVARWTSDKGNVIVAQTPEKEGLILPSEQDLLAVAAGVKGKTLTAYEDKVSQEPLLDKPPTPGKIVSEKVTSELGVTDWTLANGIHVILKPTDFKNDEIQVRGSSPGGVSLAPDSAFVSAWFASTVVDLSGLGNFDMIELKKRLAGKVVSVDPSIEDLTEDIRGSASPKDLETMFQLIYLYFTAARLDQVAYLSYKSRMEPYLRNRDADPDAAFSDTIAVTMARHSPRRPILSLALLDKLDPKASFNFYRERFADASGFTFIFVGSFQVDQIRPLVETYLGGLPSIDRKETWRDVGIRPPRGVIKKEVRKGLEPRSQVELVFSGPCEWSPQAAHDLSSLADVLRIKLREALREDQSGTYAVSVDASSWSLPDPEYNVTVSFGCDPARIDELTGDAFVQIDSLRQYPPGEVYVDKVKEAQRQRREVSLKQNGFWLWTLWSCDFYNIDRSEILKYLDRVNGLTPQAIQAAAKTYLRKDNYVQVLLYPESK